MLVAADSAVDSSVGVLVAADSAVDSSVGVLVATGSAVDSSVGVLVDSASTAPPTASPCPAGAAGAQASATRHRATSPIAAVRKANFKALRRRDITKYSCGTGASGGRTTRQCTPCGNPCQTAGRAARRLATQRNAFGGYGSTQDTVAGLPALAEYAATAGLAADSEGDHLLGKYASGRAAGAALCRPRPIPGARPPAGFPSVFLLHSALAGGDAGTGYNRVGPPGRKPAGRACGDTVQAGDPEAALLCRMLRAG